jgi:hypothetical protein
MKSIIAFAVCLLAVQAVVALPKPADEVDSFSSSFGNLFGKIKTGAKKLFTQQTTTVAPTTTTEKEVSVVPLPSTTSTEATPSLFNLIATVVELNATTPTPTSTTAPEVTTSSTTTEAEVEGTSTTAVPKLLDLPGLVDTLGNTNLLGTTPASEPDVTAAPTEITAAASTTEAAEAKPTEAQSTSTTTQAPDIPPAHSTN